MKLFRRRDTKSSHPHAAALSHLKNAHRALMSENASEGLQHIGRAFQAVNSLIPKAPKPAVSQGPAKAPPDSDGGGNAVASAMQASTSGSPLTLGQKRLSAFNKR